MGDAELVRAAQGGDVSGLGVLLERHQASLYALALRNLGRGFEAQDAVQSTFLIALGDIGRLREPEAVGGWLRGILRNVCLRRLRERRGAVSFEENIPGVGGGSFESSAEEYIDGLALREWVWAALYQLPEVLRETAMLRYFGTYSSYGEISAILGVPVGAVRSRLNQVKIKLAEALLKTAGLEHTEARRLTGSQTRFFEAGFDEYNRGLGYEMIVSALSDDLWYTRPDGVGGGVGWLMEELEDDLEVGMKLHLTNVIASKDVTVVEGDFENRPEDLYHCPPATSQVYFYRDGRIQLMREYFAPRPEKEPQDPDLRRNEVANYQPASGRAEGPCNQSGRSTMTEQQTAATLDFAALRRAAERNDAGVLADHYAEDAEVLIVNRETPPSSPHVPRGKAQIAEFLEDACGRDLESRIQDEVIGEERIAFNEECEYPDGLKVLTATTLEVRDGKISRQVSVEAWDE